MRTARLTWPEKVQIVEGVEVDLVRELKNKVTIQIKFHNRRKFQDQQSAKAYKVKIHQSLWNIKSTMELLREVYISHFSITLMEEFK